MWKLSPLHGTPETISFRPPQETVALNLHKELMMKRMIKWTLLCSVLVCLPASVMAQDEGPTAGEATGGTGGGDVQYKKETTYDFEGDDVEGALVKPDGADVKGERHGKTSSLIKIRADFIPEMLKSVEDL